MASHTLTVLSPESTEKVAPVVSLHSYGGYSMKTERCMIFKPCLQVLESLVLNCRLSKSDMEVTRGEDNKYGTAGFPFYSGLYFSGHKKHTLLANSTVIVSYLL